MRILSITITVCATAFLVVSLAAQSREVELQRAEQKELATGDLKAAISEYKRIASHAGTDHDVAVRALLRLAEAQRKLGDAQARMTYQQILHQYPDQQAAVSTARSWLNESGNNIVNRQVWSVPVETGIRVGRVSPDGHFLAYTRESDLMIRDLSKGTERSVVHLTPARPGPTLAWSPDGRHIAFEASDNGTQIRTINVDGSDMRTVSPSKSAWARVLDYFPDGERLLASMAQGSDSLVFAIRIADGNIQNLVLRSGPGGSGWPRLSPDGRYVALRNSPGLSLLATDGSGETIVSRNEYDLNAAGWAPDGSHLLFIRRVDGRAELWSVPIAGGKPNGPASLAYRDFDSLSSIENQVASDGSLYYVKSGVASTELRMVEKIIPQGK
jgi:Tol biopolymer transport system component